MGFQDDSRSALQSDLIPVVSTTATATGQSTKQSTSGKKNTGFAFLNVTAASGTTPSMTVTLETSDDGGTTWYTLPGGTFTAATAVTKQVLPISSFGVDIRANYAITGTTPSFTFKVTVSA